jgi:hypothetical protein
MRLNGWSLAWLVLAAIFASPPSSARAAQKPTASGAGPQIGERAPDFSLPDQRGVARTLDSLRGSRGTIVVFIRSADW